MSLCYLFSKAIEKTCSLFLSVLWILELITKKKWYHQKDLIKLILVESIANHYFKEFYYGYVC